MGTTNLSKPLKCLKASQMFQSCLNVSKWLKCCKASQNFQSLSKFSKLLQNFKLIKCFKALKSMKYSNTIVGRIPRFTWARLHDRKLSSTTSNSLYSSSNLVVVDRYPAFFYIKSQTCYKRAAATNACQIQLEVACYAIWHESFEDHDTKFVKGTSCGIRSYGDARWHRLLTLLLLDTW